jgi:Concanavalin A-like lectin/glucanases superfamily/Domain of unknown function (DUF2341)
MRMRSRYLAVGALGFVGWACDGSSTTPNDGTADPVLGGAGRPGTAGEAAVAGTVGVSGAASVNAAGGGGAANVAGAVSGGTAGATAGSGATSDWWDQSYAKRTRIDVDNSSGAEALKDFPIMIALDAAHFSYADAAADGHDLRFVDTAGKLLSHELELWAPNGTSIVWLKLPELAAKAKTTVSMYWGNPQAEPLPASAAQAVWSASYAGVWHFGDSGKDATGKHDSPDAKSPFVPGQVGKAASFDGSTQYFALPGAKYVSALPAITFSGWVQHKSSQPDGKGVIIGIGDELATGHASWTSVTFVDGAIVGEANPDDVARAEAPSGSGTFPNDAWNYFTVVVDIAGKKITNYKNGAPVGTVFQGAWTATAFKDLASNRASIGAEEDHGPHWFIGMLDEIRVETVARSPAWIAAQAHAQKADWLSIGPSEARK